MRIVVLGAAGRTGREVVRQAVADGHEVVAFVRTADAAPGAGIVTGDATDAADLRAAFDTADAVISTLGGKGGTLIADSTRAIVAAAQADGVKRVTVLSSFAVQRDRLSAPLKAMSALTMGRMLADKAAGEADLRASDLDWTIVYATMLTDGPRTAAAHALADGARIGARERISRADAARWLIDATTGDLYRRREVTITG